MTNKRKYYRCKKCGLNYVEQEDEICSVCKQDPNRGEYRPYPHRQTGCYACKAKLDSFYNRTCPVCGMMICRNCGSCGCAWESKK